MDGGMHGGATSHSLHGSTTAGLCGVIESCPSRMVASASPRMGAPGVQLSRAVLRISTVIGCEPLRSRRISNGTLLAELSGFTQPLGRVEV